MTPPSPDLRRRILLLVEEYPGLHLREIQRRAGCSPMLAEYHLNVLERLGLVTSVVHGRYRDFFPARQEALPLDKTDKRWLGILRRPAVLAITLLLLEKERLRSTEVAEEMGLALSTASYQLETMRDAGLTVRRHEEGRATVRLGDPARVVALLRAYHPTPDVFSTYADLWSRAFDRVRARPAPEAPIEDAPPPPQEVADMPRTVQLVYRRLLDGPCTQKEIRLETGLARRTVYAALRRLEDERLVQGRPHLSDTRQTLFAVRRDEADRHGP